MKHQLKSPPMMVALLALFVALSGTSYAAITLPKNSVGKNQIRKDAVTGSKVRNGSLLAMDFAKGQLPKGDKGDKGDKGLQGVQGVPGPKGDMGANGFGGVVVRRQDFELADGASMPSPAGNVACEAGEVLVSGGGNFSNISHGDARITGSSPRSGTAAAVTVPPISPPGVPDVPTVWRVTAINPAGGDVSTVTVRVFAICAKA